MNERSVDEASEAQGALRFATAGEWEAWLQAHYKSPEAVWLLIARKGSAETTVTVSEALDVALCYGWIDGQRKSHDEAYFLQRYSQRRPRSAWSQINVEKVAALLAAGRMHEAGLAQVEAARADGRWDAAYPPQSLIEAPDDLAAALAANERASERFSRLKRSERFSIILPIITARSEPIRAARLKKAIERLVAESVEPGGD